MVEEEGSPRGDAHNLMTLETNRTRPGNRKSVSYPYTILKYKDQEIKHVFNYLGYRVIHILCSLYDYIIFESEIVVILALAIESYMCWYLVMSKTIFQITSRFSASFQIQ